MGLASIIIMLWLTLPCGAEESAESIRAWAKLPDISKAIALRPLDDPADIIEKAEIIEDRIDALVKEKERLAKWIQEIEATQQQLQEQRRILEEVAELHRRSDSSFRQRRAQLTERISHNRTLLESLQKSCHDLQVEIERERRQAEDYRKKSQHLKMQENKP
jgi:chromosome segregation ATPase